MTRLLLTILATLALAHGDTVELACDPNPPEDQVDTYTLYQRQADGSWSAVGASTSPAVRLEVPRGGAMTAYAMTAKNIGGEESGYSDPVAFYLDGNGTVVIPRPRRPANLRIRVITEIQTP